MHSPFCCQIFTQDLLETSHFEVFVGSFLEGLDRGRGRDVFDFSCMPLEAIFFGAGEPAEFDSDLAVFFGRSWGGHIPTQARYVKTSQVILSFYLGS